MTISYIFYAVQGRGVFFLYFWIVYINLMIEFFGGRKQDRIFHFLLGNIHLKILFSLENLI